MGYDVIPEFTKLLSRIPDEKNDIDILIVSHGGDPIVSWRIVSMLRERFDKVGVLLPYAAYSAATLVALGADEIVMHPFSNLGPVDPQLTVMNSPSGKAISFGAEDLSHFFNFVRDDIRITDQEQLERAFELVCKDVGAMPIGAAKRSSCFALAIGEKLLNLHMPDSNEVKVIAETLNKSFFHHGYPLGRKEAKEKVGLPVIFPEPELEKTMWDIWVDIEKELEMNDQFNPIELVLAEPENADFLLNTPQFEIPPNFPIGLNQNIVAGMLQQMLDRCSIVTIKPVDYKLQVGILESCRCRSVFKVEGKLTAVRHPNMNIAVNAIKTSSGWIFESDDV